MKFVSKNMNLRVVLSHGIPAEPMSGRNAVPGLYVKFENGLVEVRDEETAKKMLVHQGFNSDFISVEEGEKDPYVDSRSESEPEHINTEIKFGHIGKTTAKKVTITPQQKKALRPIMEEMAKEMAVEMAKEMAPMMAKDILKNVLEERAAEVSESIEENAPVEEIDDVIDEINEEPEVTETETTISTPEISASDAPAVEAKKTVSAKSVTVSAAKKAATSAAKKGVASTVKESTTKSNKTT